jgi:hypothetical protein
MIICKLVDETGKCFAVARLFIFKAQLLLMLLIVLQSCCHCRPDVLTKKVDAADWALITSSWRYYNGLFCYLGPPANILWRIRWPMLVNIVIAILVVADAYADLATGGRGILPNIDGAVLLGWRMISFVMSLLLAFRVNRAYDRWWAARHAFKGIGTAAITLSQQAVVWIPDPLVKVGYGCLY